MERTVQKRKNVYALLALIFGCICFACFLLFLFACFIGWSEFAPYAGFLTAALFLSFFNVGPVSAILSVVFGCIVRFWKRKEGGGLSRRQEVFSNLAIAGGALYLIGVPIVLIIVERFSRVA